MTSILESVVSKLDNLITRLGKTPSRKRNSRSIDRNYSPLEDILNDAIGIMTFRTVGRNTFHPVNMRLDGVLDEDLIIHLADLPEVQ